MTPRTTILALACLLVVAAPADAIYIVTPLHATADHPTANVGDTITITIDPEPENETAKTEWGGKTVVVYATYDASEPSDDPNASMSSDASHRVPIDDALVLDAGAHATFTWTVPAEVDDKNVAILIESQDGELLAHANIAVGDAPPQIMAMTGQEGQPVETPMENGEETAGAKPTPTDEKADVPATGALALLGLAGIAALALRRRA